jgi:hypothetical protein
MISQTGTYDVIFEYDHCRQRHRLEDITYDQAIEFSRKHADKCPLITIEKVEEIYKKVRRNGKYMD